MKIGLTYDLRREYLDMGFSQEETAEFDSDETINALEGAMRGLGHEVLRIGHIYELTRRLAAGERWDLVFNISEGLYGRSREAQVPALLEAFNIHYTFSDPLTLSLCLDKAMTKSIVRDAGIRTPDFFVINSLTELERINLKEKGKFPLFVKPISEGTGKGITPDSITRDPEGFKRQVKKLLIRYQQPVLVETYLPGREYTVGILGNGDEARVVGALEVRLLKKAEPDVYSFMNKELCEERVKYVLVDNKKILDEASDVALRAYRALGCRDAARVDLKTGEDAWIYFIEMNPLAGLHPTHSDLSILCTQVGIPYKALITEIINHAVKRRKSEGDTKTRSRISASVK
jgi:D-alanine-D-alanine ligase